MSMYNLSCSCGAVSRKEKIMSANELLLNPNLAYILLVVGSLLAILAIFTPGTGVLEIGAIFILILAGWLVYNLQVNLWALVVLVLGVIPFIIAVRRSGQRIYLGAAILAFIIGSSFLFSGGEWWEPAVNPILSTVVSMLSAGFIWFTITKVMEAEKRTPSHDLSSLVGAIGETQTPVLNEGSAQIQGELWTVRSREPIPSKTKVRVVNREGFVLEVEALPKSE
jgi:membrane-bound serine protease (ClpP class)